MGGFMNQWWRVGGACGIAFLVLFIIAGFGLQGEPPMFNDDIDDIRAYWENDGENYLIGDYILGLASLLLFLPFLCALRSLLGLYEGGAQMFSRMAFTAGVIFLIIAATASASWTTLAYAADDLEDESIKLLMYLDIGAWNAGPFAIGAMLLAASLVIWRTGVLWKWLAVIGFIVGVCALISPLVILQDDPDEGVIGILGFISFIGLAVWMLITSIGMLMKREVVSMGPQDGGAAARQAAVM